MLKDSDLYRERKEASISDLTGTTMLELVLVSTPIPIGIWLLSELKNNLCQVRCEGIPALRWRDFVLESFALLLPSLASMIWPSKVGMLVILMLFAGVCCRYARGSSWRSEHDEDEHHEELHRTKRAHDIRYGNSSAPPMVNFVTNFRASMMIMTCISILAVDFQVFPRRLAKTEIFGTGLMDLGVGATIFASGLASGCRPKRQVGGARSGLPGVCGLLADMLAAALRAWPLAALGVSRLVVVKGLGYQEHVSEYGVHWNFFATLFCMRLVVVPLNRLRPGRFRLCVALSFVVYYQWLLVRRGLSDFVVEASRDTLFAMNREGILGIAGFVAIYYIAEEVGFQVWVHGQKSKKESEAASSAPSSLVIVARASIILWGLTYLSETIVQKVSRRMVNVSYVLWVSAHSTLVLCLLMVVDNLSSSPPRSCILAAVNCNMFPVFMVANLATGAVNISMKTLDADPWTAVAILSTYTVLVAGFAVALERSSLVMKV